MTIINSFTLGYIETTDMSIGFGSKVRDEDWIDLIKHYWLILLVVFIAALIIVLMPIIGWVNWMIFFQQNYKIFAE